MNRLIAEWLWRMVVVAALGWIGWELHSFHDDMLQPISDQTTAAASPGEVLDSLDGMRDELANLSQKVDAILVVLAKAK